MDDTTIRIPLMAKYPRRDNLCLFKSDRGKRRLFKATALVLTLWVLIVGMLACKASPTPTPTPTPTSTSTPTVTPTSIPVSLSSLSYETRAWAIIVLCILVPLFIIIALQLIPRYIRQQKVRKLETTHQQKIQALVAAYGQEVQKLKNDHQQAIQQLTVIHKQRVEQLEATYKQELENSTQEKVHNLSKIESLHWLMSLAKHHWQDNTPEIEVEIKFVFPLLKYLGYSEGEMALRAPVTLTEGSQEMTLQADWVVQHNSIGALLVVEAKAPRIKLNRTTQNQARSYAFHLEAPVYITTNGKEIKIFHRDVLQDRCIVSCKTSHLEQHWKAIQQAAGRSSAISLKKQLTKH
jgi:hypothetical protein